MKHLLLLLILVGFVASEVVIDVSSTYPIAQYGTATIDAAGVLTYTHTSGAIDVMLEDSVTLYFNDPAESVTPNPRTTILVHIYPITTIVLDTLYVREGGSVSWTPSVNY